MNIILPTDLLMDNANLSSKQLPKSGLVQPSNRKLGTEFRQKQMYVKNGKEHEQSSTFSVI
jgi:hypothetical protein